MKTKSIIGLILIVMVMVGIPAASAQPRPTIVTFSSSVKTISVTDAETNASTTTLSWDVVGMSDDYRLTLHYYVLDGWELVFAPEGVPLEASDARLVTIKHPLTFAPPTYLLSIVSRSSNKIVDQRTLTIPYAKVADEDVTIESFAEDAEPVARADLMDGLERYQVAWEVLNRPPTANLVFEQVNLAGGTRSVEYPRLNLWVPSVSQGPVGPLFYEEDAEVVTLRLSVVDVLTGEVYAEQDADISLDEPPVSDAATEPDTDTASPADADTETPASDTADAADATTEPDVQPGADTTMPIERTVSFTAAPATVAPGGAVTLAWDIVDGIAATATQGVTITQAVPNVTAAPVVVQMESAQGSAVVNVPDYAAYSVTYTLVTDDGQSTAVVDVSISCPYTYFFGTGEGCPAASAFTVGAVYQAFEGGAMLWRSDTNEIYVHFSDGSARYFTESDYANLPDPVLQDMPPLDRQAPSEGFGKVWANVSGIQDRLGWALRDEVGYNATVQRVALTRDPRPAWAFYFTLPDGTVVGSGFGLWRNADQ